MGSVNVILEHPDNADVLFLGTEHALFVSTDAGAHWAKMPNLPTTLYDDVIVHPREKDLVIATHGRAFWILDDTRPLVEWAAAGGGAAHLFSVAPATLMQYKKDTSYRGQADFAGKNPDDGVYMTYRLAPGSGDALLRIARPDGRVVREMTVPSTAGTHRINWDLRHPLPGQPDVWRRFEDPRLARPIEERGPFVSPGRYTVTLVARGVESTQTVDVRGDPEMPITVAQYQTRERFLLDLLELRREATATMRAMGVSAGGGFGRPQGDPGSPENRIRAVTRALTGVYGGLNGNQAQPGSLYPPTGTMRDVVTAARVELEALKAAVRR
jgi:hypothetical protein